MSQPRAPASSDMLPPSARPPLQLHACPQRLWRGGGVLGLENVLSQGILIIVLIVIISAIFLLNNLSLQGGFGSLDPPLSQPVSLSRLCCHPRGWRGLVPAPALLPCPETHQVPVPASGALCCLGGLCQSGLSCPTPPTLVPGPASHGCLPPPIPSSPRPCLSVPL